MYKPVNLNKQAYVTIEGDIKSKTKKRRNKIRKTDVPEKETLEYFKQQKLKRIKSTSVVRTQKLNTSKISDD